MKVKCQDQSYEMEEIVEKYTDMLFRLAMIRMKQKEDAEEVVQDTFLKLLYQIKKGKSFQDEEHLKAWLLRVAVNRGKSILTLAWNKRTEGIESAMQIAAEGKKESYAYDYVMQLPEKYRVAINLFYYEELTTQQIAEIMETKETTVRSYLHRGREKLKAMMEADV